MRQLFFAIPFLCITTQASAQLVQRIGMQQGLAFSHLSYDPEPFMTLNDKSARLIGYTARVYAELFKDRYFHVSPGIGFIQRGGADPNRFLIQGGSIARMATASSIDYISIDVCAKGTYPVGKFSPYILAGPRVDVLLNASKEFAYFDQVNALNGIRRGVRYGAGLSYAFKAFDVFAEWTALWDLDDVTAPTDEILRDINGDVLLNTLTTIKDRTHMFSVGVAVRLCGDQG